MNYITNTNQLTEHGWKQERKLALDCLNVALDAANTYTGTKKVVSCDENELVAGDQHIPWNVLERIFIIGAGKGTYPIVKALHEILGMHVTGGVVALKETPDRMLPPIELMKTAHPVPNEQSLAAGQKFAELAGNLTERDLVFACMTGGCSSLVVLPPDQIPFEDVRTVGNLLMRCGAPIHEMNAVRKHICRIKGGGLLRLLAPAMVITLTQDTRPEELPWPDPVMADPSTFEDAIQVLKKYEMWGKTPESVRSYLIYGMEHPELETPKQVGFIRHAMYDVGNQRTACEAAAEFAKSQGYHAAVLSTMIEGEAKEVGSVFAGIAKEIQLYGHPFEPPCVLMSAGETRVSVCEEPGEGGPNQEFAIGFAMNIKQYAHIVCASIDSEGTDGPTEIAGGITDSSTSRRAQEKDISLFDALKRNNSSHALTELEDAVVTVPTGTNVVNLRVLVVGKGGAQDAAN